MTDPWFWARRARPAAATRLVCIPYAGGIASTFRAWDGLVPDDVEVCPAELPGHGARMSEEPFHRLEPLVSSLADALEPLLDRPCALFGHSMGGLIAFELTRLLRRRGWPEPCHLFVSASPAPRRRHEPVAHDASDAGLKARLRTLAGTPHEVLENDELMALVLPVIRADFAVLEAYEYYVEPPLPVPITVFGGIDDRTVRPAELQGWHAQSTGSSQVRLLPGDHFFLHDRAPELLGVVTEQLSKRKLETTRHGNSS